MTAAKFDQTCYRMFMLNMRIKGLAARTERALDRLGAVGVSVVALEDEDLLDLADILAAGDPTPPRDMAAVETRRRTLGP